jgi:hypothetical protein
MCIFFSNTENKRRISTHFVLFLLLLPLLHKNLYYFTKKWNIFFHILDSRFFFIQKLYNFFCMFELLEIKKKSKVCIVLPLYNNPSFLLFLSTIFFRFSVRVLCI